ncbi:MAG: M1 family metallopeptidase [Bacteroidota bacterium]|nr:M1 family metallopeptidase [Bacteroidota bacterium]
MRYLILFYLFAGVVAHSQYWQQEIDYKIEVNFDDINNQYKGFQKIKYTNNSPETLRKVFFHLYFNAFKPGSEMAIRQDNSADKNTRFKIDIDSLDPKQQGFLKVYNLYQNGKLLETVDSETILEVELNAPLLPSETTEFSMEFMGQVPDLVRRAGKNSRDGIEYSMAQWYPKMCEYDSEGWNADPYTGREFHGVWGNFDVKIRIDKEYTVAASGYLQNSDDIGKGYSKRKKSKSKKGKVEWHFIAPNVHDFTWSADKNYIHDTYSGPNDVTLHFFYKNDAKIIDNWKKLQPYTAKMMEYFNSKVGVYPYKQYTVAQGGDGGMEYAMMTLITGGRSFNSLFGVTCHELAHSWFQHVLATNETKHEWMDEGFTTFISTLAEDEILEENKEFPMERSYNDYYRLALSGTEMPQSTNANRYEYNYAYENTAYDKGAVFLSQLGYIVGEDILFKTLQEYFNEWKFKHPRPNDFRRVAERISGIQLQWYLTDWTQTTNVIDYKIDKVDGDSGKTKVILYRKGLMPMPLEVLIKYNDGQYDIIYIPISLMRGEKNNPYNVDWKVKPDWVWANPYYSFDLDKGVNDIEAIIIDPSNLMADVDKTNNYYLPKMKKFEDKELEK